MVPFYAKFRICHPRVATRRKPAFAARFVLAGPHTHGYESKGLIMSLSCTVPTHMNPAHITTIDRLPPRSQAVVVSCSGPASFRLQELGLLPGTHIRLLRRAPLRDPLQIQVGQSLLALRLREARSVQVEPLASDDSNP